MPFYKDTENKLHFIESAEFEHLLPSGSIQITDEQADELIPTPQPPSSVSCDPWQIRKALSAAGMRPSVEAYIASDAASLEEKDGWHHAPRFSSDSPFVLSVGAMLGLNAEGVRAFIEQAATL